MYEIALNAHETARRLMLAAAGLYLAGYLGKLWSGAENAAGGPPGENAGYRAAEVHGDIGGSGSGIQWVTRQNSFSGLGSKCPSSST